MKRKKLLILIIILVGLILLVFGITTIKNVIYESKVRAMKDNSELQYNIQSNIEKKELKQNGYSIYYYTAGSKDKELIVFLHPAFADHRCFNKQIDFFAKDYGIITIDMLGHGLSKVNKAKDKIDQTVHHIDSILQIEGYNSAHFVGVSMGTLIAQYYALLYPEKIRSMTILGGYDINADNKELVKAQRKENMKWMLKALFSMNSFRRYAASVTVINPVEQARFYEMASLFTRKSFTCMSGLANVVKPRNSIERNYPLLIMCGDHDIELARKISKKWHEEEPSSSFHIIENAGHCANMDKPDEFNRIVMDFISK